VKSDLRPCRNTPNDGEGLRRRRYQPPDEKSSRASAFRAPPICGPDAVLLGMKAVMETHGMMSGSATGVDAVGAPGKA
jgi:hypothetical protein